MTAENSPKIEEEVKYMEEMSYASVVGSIMYAMVCSKSDLAYVIGMISRFMSNSGREHWNAMKWVLRYLKGSTDVGILYGDGAIGELGVVEGYVDSDYAGSADTRKSLTGYVFTLFGGTIMEASLQSMVALSSTETVKEALWVKGMIGELGLA